MTTSKLPFADRLATAVLDKVSPVCVGLDPRWMSLPDVFRENVAATDLTAKAKATAEYCKAVLDATAEFAPVVKPQAAFFELLGPAGMQALAEVIIHARQLGMLVLMDAKRGDIGSTAEGYAAAYLGDSSAWQCDALTINPYLGADTLEPFIQAATREQAGIFTLVKTSNPGSGFIQNLEADGSAVYKHVARTVEKANQEFLSTNQPGISDCGPVGAVVGATYPQELAELRDLMPHAWFLIPGFGAQGGTAEDVKAGFKSTHPDAHVPLGAIVNSSRGIIFAYQQDRYAGKDWQEAVADAARSMAQELIA